MGYASEMFLNHKDIQDQIVEKEGLKGLVAYCSENYDKLQYIYHVLGHDPKIGDKFYYIVSFDNRRSYVEETIIQIEKLKDQMYENDGVTLKEWMSKLPEDKKEIYIKNKEYVLKTKTTGSPYGILEYRHRQPYRHDEIGRAHV